MFEMNFKYRYKESHFTEPDNHLTLIDFNGIPTHLVSFYAKALENRCHCTSILKFLYNCFLRVFFVLSIRIIFKQINLTYRWDPAGTSTLGQSIPRNNDLEEGINCP